MARNPKRFAAYKEALICWKCNESGHFQRDRTSPLKTTSSAQPHKSKAPPLRARKAASDAAPKIPLSAATNDAARGRGAAKFIATDQLPVHEASLPEIMRNHYANDLAINGFAGPSKAPLRVLRSVPPVYENVPGNTAQSSYLNNDSADDQCTLPDSFDPFKDPFDAASFDQIAVETGTHLVANPLARRDTQFRVSIWGTREQCAGAKKLLKEWSSARHRTASAVRPDFPTIGGYVGEEKEKAALSKEKSLVSQKQFLITNTCDPDLYLRRFKFATIVKFKEADWKFAEVLGRGFEALNQLRTDNRCNIIHLDNMTIRDEQGNPWNLGEGFFIVGNKQPRIDNAAHRLQHIDRQVIARRIEPQAFTFMKQVAFPVNYSSHKIAISDYPTPKYHTTSMTQVRVQDREKIMRMVDASADKPKFLRRKRLIRSIHELDAPLAVKIGTRYTEQLNLQCIDACLTTMLEHLAYLRASMKMRISFGTPVFTRHKTAKEYSLAQFEELIHESNIEEGMKAYMPAELGSLEVESELLTRFYNSNDSLRYIDRVEGKEVFPRCTVIFRLAHPTSTSKSLRLEVNYVENGCGDYIRDKHQWTVLHDNEEEPTKILDIRLLDMKTSFTSTSMTITTEDQIKYEQEDKLPSHYSRFLTRVAIKQENVMKGEPMFQFEGDNGRSSIRIHGVEERRSWMFQTPPGQGGGYDVELFATRVHDLTKRGPFSLSTERWGVQVYHRQWDTLFACNPYLGVGQRAEWAAEEWEFFPPAGMHDSHDIEGMEWEVGNGYQNLAKALEIVENVILNKPQVKPMPQPIPKPSGNINGIEKPREREQKLMGQSPDAPKNDTSKPAKPIVPDVEVLVDIGGEASDLTSTPAEPIVPEAGGLGDIGGAASDLLGLVIVPVGKSSLEGAALDLADIDFF